MNPEDLAKLTDAQLAELRRSLPHRDGESVTDYELRHFAIRQEQSRRQAAIEIAAQRAEEDRQRRVAQGDASAMTHSEWEAHCAAQGWPSPPARPVAPVEPDPAPGTSCLDMSATQWSRHVGGVMADVPRAVPGIADVVPGVVSALDLSAEEWRRYQGEIGISSGSVPIGAAGSSRESDERIERDRAVRRERARDAREIATLDELRQLRAQLASQAAAPTIPAVPTAASITPERQAEIAALRRWATSRGAR